MKLSINGVTDQNEEKAVITDDSLENKKSNQKCRYNDRGFCKSKLDCVYYHSNTICDKLLLNGQCPQPKTCLSRHPRDCKHWTGDTRGCLRENLCKYMHNSTKKGINIKTKKNNNESDSKVQNITVSPKEATEAKDKVIKEKDEEIARLRSENESLMENNSRMKRIAWKMDQEIKVLRSKLT